MLNSGREVVEYISVFSRCFIALSLSLGALEWYRNMRAVLEWTGEGGADGMEPNTREKERVLETVRRYHPSAHESAGKGGWGSNGEARHGNKLKRMRRRERKGCLHMCMALVVSKAIFLFKYMVRIVNRKLFVSFCFGLEGGDEDGWVVCDFHTVDGFLWIF